MVSLYKCLVYLGGDVPENVGVSVCECDLSGCCVGGVSGFFVCLIVWVCLCV